MSRIFEVETVELRILKSNPPQIAVHAGGFVSTSGWTAPELAPWRYVTPPADGIQDFDFNATPPTGIVLQVIRPITAERIATRDPMNYWGEGRPLRGVRVHAQTNNLVDPLDPERPQLLMADAIDDFIVKPQFGDVAAEPPLVGKSLRVYHTGDGLTLDLNPNRANVELGPDERIVRVWIG